MKLTANKLRKIIKEEILKEIRSKYNTDEIIRALKPLVKIVPRDVVWNVPYNSRTDNKKVTGSKKALKLIQQAIKELEEKGDDTGEFVVSEVYIDSSKFDSAKKAGRARQEMRQVAKGEYYYNIYKLADFFDYNPEILDAVEEIYMRLWTDLAKSHGRKMSRGDLGRLD